MIFCLAASATASSVQAGVYTDDLSKCLVTATKPADQSALVVWIFALMSAHPDVRPYSSLTDAQRIETNKRGADVMVRLLTEDCRSQTVAALKYEGETAITASFKVLGEVAMRGLMTDPSVAKGLAQVGSYMDMNKLEALGKEAGLGGAKAKP